MRFFDSRKSEVWGLGHPRNYSFWGDDFHPILRKAVRRTDSLLFATEGRIGGLGGERRFWARNLAVPLAGGCANGVVFMAMYRVAIC